MTPAVKPDFIASTNYAGAKERYSFREGERGVGYYLNEEAKVPQSPPAFIDTNHQYQGQKEGYSFREGDKGVGYYLNEPAAAPLQTAPVAPSSPVAASGSMPLAIRTTTAGRQSQGAIDESFILQPQSPSGVQSQTVQAPQHRASEDVALAQSQEMHAGAIQEQSRELAMHDPTLSYEQKLMIGRGILPADHFAPETEVEKTKKKKLND